jgi:hypothetical protein
VRFQVGREPYTKIAASARRDRQAVTEAIKGLAELLGLILRTSAPGRPRATRGPLKNRPHRVSRTPRS